MNPLLAQLTHQPFPEVAEILRLGADQITLKWDTAVRLAMPQMRHLTFDELKDSTPQILLAISHDSGHDVLWVSDEGPGIAPEQMGHIFEAFRRGEIHGQQGVGLGLAIASQAAKLLDAILSVDRI